MPHIVVVLAAVLAMLFNVIGVPGQGSPRGTATDIAPDAVMMVLDQVSRRA